MIQASLAHERLVLIVCLVGYGILFFLTALPGQPLLYDERSYLEPVASLKEHGLSLKFIKEYPQPAGLLHNVMHWTLEPLTGLEPPLVRLVNPVLLELTIVSLSLTLKQLASQAAPSTSLTMVGIPFVWVLTGFALTEMLAIFLSSWSIYCLVLGKRLQATRLLMALAIAFLGGILLGAAFLSRAPAIVILFATPLLILTEIRRSFLTILSFTLGAAIFPVSLTLCWGGFIPPNSPVLFQSSDFSFYNAALSLSYASVAMIILAPRWFAIRMSVILTTVGTVILFNGRMGLVEINAGRHVIEQLPTAFSSIWPRLAGSGMLALAVLFTFSTVKNLYQQRHDTTWLFLCTAMILVVASTGKITHQFSSRYTGLASGLMVLVSEPYSLPTVWKCVRLGVGMLIGLLSLLSYYATAH